MKNCQKGAALSPRPLTMKCDWFSSLKSDTVDQWKPPNTKQPGSIVLKLFQTSNIYVTPVAQLSTRPATTRWYFTIRTIHPNSLFSSNFLNTRDKESSYNSALAFESLKTWRNQYFGLRNVECLTDDIKRQPLTHTHAYSKKVVSIFISSINLVLNLLNNLSKIQILLN